MHAKLFSTKLDTNPEHTCAGSTRRSGCSGTLSPHGLRRLSTTSPTPRAVRPLTHPAGAQSGLKAGRSRRSRRRARSGMSNSHRAAAGTVVLLFTAPFLPTLIGGLTKVTGYKLYRTEHVRGRGARQSDSAQWATNQPTNQPTNHVSSRFEVVGSLGRLSIYGDAARVRTETLLRTRNALSESSKKAQKRSSLAFLAVLPSLKWQAFLHSGQPLDDGRRDTRRECATAWFCLCLSLRFHGIAECVVSSPRAPSVSLTKRIAVTAGDRAPA